MTTYATTTGRRPALLPLVTLVIAVLMTATSGLVAVWWNAIDERFIEAADDAGWDETLLLPHQMGLTLAIDGLFVLCAVLSVVSVVAVRRSRRG